MSYDKENIENTEDTPNENAEDSISNENNTKVEKASFFKKIFSFFRKEEEINPNEALKNYSVEYSKFREYAFLLDDSEEDESVNYAIDLCDDNLKLARHRAYFDKKRRDCEIVLKDLECYNNLSEGDAKLLKNLINKFVHINNERRGLRYQLGDFNSSINKLEALEEDAYDAISQIEEAEAEKRILKRDIQIIKNERERTSLDREKLNFAYNIIYKFSFIFSFILGISIVVLTLLYMNSKENVFFPLAILCFTLILTITLIYVFRRKIIFELKLNEKKQAKLLALLNKKTVVYSYYINFLNYEYRKYNVKNSRILKENLENFENYKHITGRYDKLGKIAYEIQQQLEQFISENKILIENISLETFAKSINVDNKISYYKEVENKKKKLEKRISEIDKEQGELFEKLVELNVNDTSKEKVIEKIIKAYMIESEKIIFDEEKDIDKLDEDE